MATPLNRRQISGNRVLCKCAMDLPKVDPFYQMKIHREGYMVMNTRGGALYLQNQFTDHTIKQIFKPNEAGLIRNFIVYSKADTYYKLGNVKARFLKFTSGDVFQGMILRFVNLNEEQLDLLNHLVAVQPKVAGNEQEFVSKIWSNLM